MRELQLRDSSGLKISFDLLISSFGHITVPKGDFDKFG
jgi:hypothetical protein